LFFQQSGQFNFSNVLRRQAAPTISRGQNRTDDSKNFYIEIKQL